MASTSSLVSKLVAAQSTVTRDPLQCHNVPGPSGVLECGMGFKNKVNFASVSSVTTKTFEGRPIVGQNAPTISWLSNDVARCLTDGCQLSYR